jgi:type IV pilus assembly protein PilM
MWMFSEQTIIGLDIGTDSIKMTEVKNGKQGKELLTYGAAKHDLALNGYWDSTKLRQLARIIEDVMDSGDFSAVKTVMSVPSKDVYVTTMDFDIGLNRKQIQAEIEKQAPYFLPYPPDEMRLSWSLIENDPRIKSYTGKQRVIINALPDFVIENSKNLLEHCNLDGVALENQTISQIRAILDPDYGNTVLVDVGANQTTFNIIVDGVLRSSSHIPIGSEKITEELAENLGIKNSTAEHLKKDFALVNLFEMPKPIINNLIALKTELQTFIELNKKVAQPPEKVVFTGGGVYVAGFLKFFSNLQIPIYLGNSSRKIKIPPDYIPYVNPILNQLSTAIGLALREDV